MNLKRIIREEINDMKWINDVEADELAASPYISFRTDDEMRHIVKHFVDDIDNIDEDLLFNLATDQGYRWSEKHQGWWHSSERVNPKSIREEMDQSLQWIKDIKSNKDIAEELFNQTVITKDKGIVKFPFMTSNIHPKKYYFDISIKRKYGKGKDSDDIWERYKVLVNDRLKELRPKNLKESNSMEWINDINPIPEIKIGTCFVDEMSGGLKGGKWIIKSIRENPSMTIIEVVNSKGKSVTLNKKYFEEDLINGRYKGCTESIKESNDMAWVDESMPTLKDAFYNRFFKVGDIVTLSGRLVDENHEEGVSTDNFKVKIEKLGSFITSSDFTPLQREYWGHLGYSDKPLRFCEEDGDLSVVSIE